VLTTAWGYPEEEKRLGELGVRVEKVGDDWGGISARPFLFPDFAKLPNQVREFAKWRGRMRKRVAEHLSLGVDLIQVEHSTNGIWLDGLECLVPKVLVFYDVRTMYEKRIFMTRRTLRDRAAAFVEWRRMRAYEKRVVGLFDSLVVLSEQERAALRGLTGRDDISIVPNGVDTRYFSPRPVKPSPHSIVFTGGLFWPPNYEGVLFFAREVLPLVWREVPDATLTVVGPRPHESLLTLASDTRIVVKDETIDHRPFIADAAVYIVPLFAGAGTRIKILEAMAMGTPVVSTSVGAEGHPVAHGREILIADRPADFASCVCRLLKDPRLASVMGSAGLEFVRRTSDYRLLAPKMDAVYTTCATKREAGERNG
jgi:glycosyltransferase involved in cell wall biosynthesis